MQPFYLLRLKDSLKKLIKKSGYEIHKTIGEFPSDFTQKEVEIIKFVKPYTMTSNERLFALIEAVRYVIHNRIPGSIVECGVWRGGSMMAVAKTLDQLNRNDIDLYLFDTFQGMPIPSKYDVDKFNKPAISEFNEKSKDGKNSNWCFATLDEVQKNMILTNYPEERIHLIKGKVENTIPERAPEVISILRLDTDWYESTKHELENLFPRLSQGGVIIIDDYGYWSGAKKAVDEYFLQNNIMILLNRVDNTGRAGIKLAQIR